MLWIHGKLYTFYDHFLEQIERRKILLEWVETALLEPDEIEYSKSTGRQLYDKYIPDINRWLRVVVDEYQAMIVTTHYLDNRKPTTE
jgi:hypothetical protein